MPTKQPSWSKFEAAILLEALVASIDGSLNRADAIRYVSDSLRKMAVNQGIEIDETFRNENGILFQMHSMESAFYGKTIFKPATKLFNEIARVYYDAPNEFQRLLKEAKAMIDKHTTIEDDFMQYLAEKVPPSQFSELCACYSEIEAFCIRAKVLNKPLFETTDFDIIKDVLRTIEQNIIFKFRHRKKFNEIVTACRHYYVYIEEGLFHKTEQVKNSESPVELPAETPVEPPVETSVETSDETSDVSNPEPKQESKAEMKLTRTAYDERLLQKYPVIYKRIFSILYEASDNEISIGALCDAINHIARPAVLEEILDNVSWAKSNGDNYIFSVEIVDHSVAIDEEDCTAGFEQEETCSIDFNGKYNLAYSKPKSFTYFDEEKPFGNSWTDLYVSFVEAIHEDYPHIFVPGMSFSNRNSRVDLARNDNCTFMNDAKPIPGTDLMLETNLSSTNIVDKIKFILDICNVDYENVVITYSRKTATIRKEETNPARSDIASVNSAKRLSSDVYNSVSFTHYLEDTSKMTEALRRCYVSAIKDCESFAKSRHLASWKLYVDDRSVAEETIRLLMNNVAFKKYNTKQNNILQVALQKYLAFIGGNALPKSNIEQHTEKHETYSNAPYEAVLTQYFAKGFRMGSPLEIRKFRRYYSEIHKADLTASDEKICSVIKDLCVTYEGKAFLPQVMLSDELRDKLFKYIKESFDEGKTAIYYQAIFTKFADDFLDQHIHDVNMLKAYLTATGNGRFYINRSFISKKANVVLDSLSEIRSCLLAFARPVKYDELYVALPHLPQSKIKYILATSAEFVYNGQSAYFHEKIIQLSDEELEGIAEIISQTIADKEFISGNELYDAIKMKYGYIIEDNKAISVYGFRDALKVKFGDRFSFKGNIISRSGAELSMADVFARYARTHDKFTLSELQVLASNLSTIIYFDVVYGNSLRISKDEFVSKHSAHFSIADTDEALDRICVKKYIPITEVENFGGFPYAGFTWNSFLLEQYVASYSQKYKLLHSSFNGTKCAGAIVRRSAGIDSFDDLIVDLLVNNPIELKKEPVLQFLNDNGYLARRKYSEIESLIIKANAQRQRKDKD